MIAVVILLVAAVVWRVLLGVTHSHDLGWLHNFAPLSAIALCGAAFLPRRLALILPLAALFVSDLFLNFYYSREHGGVSLLSFEMVARYLALALIVGIGWKLRESRRASLLMGGSVVASVVFYLVTNTGSWITEPRYARSFAGWIQALTSGLPEYPSTLVFYRHTLISDILFTALFIVCIRFANRSPEPVVAHSQA